MPLQRTIALRYAVVFVIANIIGSGVYKKVAPMSAELHSPLLVLLCFLAGGVITLFGALCVAELGAMMPEAGGEFRYHDRIYGRFFAFIYGWASYTIIKTGTIASLAYVFAQSLHQIVPIPDLLPSIANVNFFGVFFPFQSLSIKLIAIGLILLLTLFNTRGITLGVHLSATILAMVIIGILTIVLSGAVSGVGQYQKIVAESSGAFHVSSFFTAMLSAFFAYEGWNSIAFVGGEVKNPQKNIPASLTIGVFVVIAVYLLVNTTYLSILSIAELEAIFNTRNGITAVEAMAKISGKGGAVAISVLIVITTFGCLHSSIVSNSRIYYAMANQGLFFGKAKHLNARSAPDTSLWMQGIWSSLLVLSGTFDQLTDMLIFAAFIFYGAMAFGVVILRRREPLVPRPYKVWGYPFVPILFAIFSAMLVGNSIFSRPREATMGLVLIAAGIPFYYWFTKNNKEFLRSR